MTCSMCRTNRHHACTPRLVGLLIIRRPDAHPFYGPPTWLEWAEQHCNCRHPYHTPRLT